MSCRPMHVAVRRHLRAEQQSTVDILHATVRLRALRALACFVDLMCMSSLLLTAWICRGHHFGF